MIRLLSTSIVAVAAALAPILAGPSDNLVANGGFETVTEDGRWAAGWMRLTMAGARLVVDSGVSHSGSRSGRVDGTAPEQQGRYVRAWRQDIGPLPSASLWVSMWVKARNLTDGRVNILHKDPDGDVLFNQHLASFEGTFDWREIGGIVTPVQGATALQLVMGLVRSSGSVWFDDVVVAPLADQAANFGEMRMEPDGPGPAGGKRPVQFHFTIGRCGIEPGGSLMLQWQRWRPAAEFRLGKFSVHCDQPGARFRIAVPARKRTWPPQPRPTACIATLQGPSALKPGAHVTISASMTYTQHTNVSCRIVGLIAPRLRAAGRPMAGGAVVRARPGAVADLRCIAEARPLIGQPGRLVVAVTDKFGNPVEDFRGTVRLAGDASASLPSTYTFTAADAGSHEFAITFAKARVVHVTARLGGLLARSNPILPRSGGEPGVFFGDIHSHCEISADAVGSPDHAYDYARRFWGLDFAALSDHSPRGELWRRAVEAANRHNQPGSFVTFVAFEWSDPRHGHRNIYYRGNDGPEMPLGKPDNMQSWWKFLDAQGVRALTIPHHPNTVSRARGADGKPVWGPMDWSAKNHKYQRVVEICQNRGSFELPGGPFPQLRVLRKDEGASVQTALALGHRLGFIASTDTHSGRPGTGTGRCAIIAPELTRPALWDALYARRCYATSGAHLLVFFSLNGRPMGSEINGQRPDTARTIDWRVIGTSPIRQVDLLCNNRIYRSWQGNGREDVSGSLRHEGRLNGLEWWYLRVVQEDGEMAWSSPIWISSGSFDAP